MDVVLDALGGDVFDASLRALVWCGRIVVIGFAAEHIPEVKSNYLLVKNISVSGLQWSDYRERGSDRVVQVQSRRMEMYERALLKPHIMRTYPLVDFAQAMPFVQAGRAIGKIVLIVEEP